MLAFWHQTSANIWYCADKPALLFAKIVASWCIVWELIIEWQQSLLYNATMTCTVFWSISVACCCLSRVGWSVDLAVILPTLVVLLLNQSFFHILQKIQLTDCYCILCSRGVCCQLVLITSCPLSAFGHNILQGVSDVGAGKKSKWKYKTREMGKCFMRSDVWSRKCSKIIFRKTANLKVQLICKTSTTVEIKLKNSMIAHGKSKLNSWEICIVSSTVVRSEQKHIDIHLHKGVLIPNTCLPDCGFTCMLDLELGYCAQFVLMLVLFAYSIAYL